MVLPTNEPVLNYRPHSEERIALEKVLIDCYRSHVKIPMYIGGRRVHTGQKREIHPPHNHSLTLGEYSQGNKEHVEQAIKEALKAHKAWADKPQWERNEIFIKAADLLATKWRIPMNAATMAGQSKNAFQAEIDAACELIDFWRFNAHFAKHINLIQPLSPEGTSNRLAYRPLEGFVFALTPFNFTSIAGNLPTAPALMGNVVVWKPADSQIYSAHIIMEILLEAGLPEGVINLVYCDGPEAGEVVFNHPEFAGLHFTGSTSTFKHLWKTIGANVDIYRDYPRIVGETGGKDFIIAHPSADLEALNTALVRGAFEFQGQKCSAVSRAYLPESIWEKLESKLINTTESLKMGPPEDFHCFVNAVIDQKAFDKITDYIEKAKASDNCKVLCGGTYDNTKGYFVTPTILLTSDPHFLTMEEEIFGPVLTIYVYEDHAFEQTLDLVNNTSPYALTGAIFSRLKEPIELAQDRLKYSAGNFYINDKPTGAVVGQQPFGGARASGTNDKAGAIFNLTRWTNVQTIKTNHYPPRDYRYPFME